MTGYSVAEPTEAESAPFPGADGKQFNLISELGLEEMRVRLWYFEPGGTSNLHRHGVQEEVYYFIDGPAKVQVGSVDDPEVIEVSSGSVVKVDADLPRQIINNTDDTLRLLAVSAPNQMEGDIWDGDKDEWVTLQEWFQR